MAFCIHCGAKLPGNTKFCPYCGKPISAPAPAPAKKKLPFLVRLFLILLIIIMGLFLISVVWYLLEEVFQVL